MAEIIHIPGRVVTHKTIGRQRCLWCGAILQEWDLRRVSLAEDERHPDWRGMPIRFEELAWWDDRKLVAVDGDHRWQIDHEEISDLERTLSDGVYGSFQTPKRACMNVLPADPSDFS